MKLTVFLLAFSIFAALALPQYEGRRPPQALKLCFDGKGQVNLPEGLEAYVCKDQTTCDEAINDLANENGLNDNEKQEIVQSILAQAESGDNTSDDNGNKWENCIEILKKCRRAISLNK